MLRESVHTARKPVYCGTGEHVVPAGTRYRAQTTSPGHDGVEFLDLRTNETRGRWMTWRRCADCCERLGTPLLAASERAGP